MRFRASRRCALAGSLLLLAVAAGSLAAAGPPFPAVGSRHAWLFDQGSFRPQGAGRWIEQGPRGRRTYLENQRGPNYLELFEPARKRYLRLYPWGMYVYVPAKKHFGWVCPGRWEHAAKRPLDHTRNSTDRIRLVSSDQRASFPRLGEEFEVLAPATVTYNCIGWSLGHTRSWVWPTVSGQPASLYHFDGLYRYYGFYRVAGLDYSRQPGLDKVVLYASQQPDGRIAPTHAALQMTDGSWSSKLGSLPLIRHLHPNDVAGPSYGSPWVLYVRPRSGKR